MALRTGLAKVDRRTTVISWLEFNDTRYRKHTTTEREGYLQDACKRIAERLPKQVRERDMAPSRSNNASVGIQAFAGFTTSHT